MVAAVIALLDVPPTEGDATSDYRLLFAIAVFGVAVLMIVYVRRRRRSGAQGPES